MTIDDLIIILLSNIGALATGLGVVWIAFKKRLEDRGRKEKIMDEFLDYIDKQGGLSVFLSGITQLQQSVYTLNHNSSAIVKALIRANVLKIEDIDPKTITLSGE